MEQWFDRFSRRIGAARSRRDLFTILAGTFIVGMAQGGGCPTSPSSSSGGGSSSSSSNSSSCPCNRGNTYNVSSRTCCPSDTPYYFPVGSHAVSGVQQGRCYASCPYVGDCGSQFQSC
jgi:hypothetical protein